MTTRTREHDPHVGLIASYLRELRRSGRRDAAVQPQSPSQVERWRIQATPAPLARETASPRQ